MTDISPNPGPITGTAGVPHAVPEGTTQKINENEVTQGYDTQNSMSLAKGVNPIAQMASTRETGKPVLENEPPVAPKVPPGKNEPLESPEEKARIVQDAANIHFLGSLLSAGIEPEKSLLALAHVEYINNMEPADKPAVRAVVNDHIDQLKIATIDGQLSQLKAKADVASGKADVTKSVQALTQGKLEEILQSLVNKLSEIQSTKAQEEIKAAAKEKAKLYEELTEKLEIEDSLVKEISKPNTWCDDMAYSLSYGGFEVHAVEKANLKTVKNEIEELRQRIGVLDPKLSTLAISLNKIPATSRLLVHAGDPNIEDKHRIAKDVETLLDSRGLDKQVFSPKTAETQDLLKSAQEETIVEGVIISKDSMSQAEFMKLLQKLQAANENAQELEEAIAALQAGDPKSAAEKLSEFGSMAGLSNEDSQTLNQLLSAILNPESTLEAQQQTLQDLIKALEDVAKDASEQLVLQSEMNSKKTVVKG